MARTTEKTSEILNKVLTSFQKAYSDNLKKEGHIASGNLANNQSFEVEYSGSNWIITLNMEPYWKYLEYGTKPHFPPIDALMSWIKVKKILPRSNKNGKTLPTRQLAFLIGRKIAKSGTKGTHTLENTMNSFGFKNKVLRAIFAKHKEDIDKTFATVFNTKK